MSKFEVKLLDSKLVDVNIKLNFSEVDEVNVEGKYSATVHEPKDSTNTTALVKTKCELFDSTKEVINIVCNSEMYFQIEPTPENYPEVLMAHSQKMIQEDILEKIRNIIHAMGHEFGVK